MEHGSVRSNVPLGPMTTYKVGGSARWFAEPQDLEELRSILELVPEGTYVVVLGRGSNVVISDEGIDGLVLRLGGTFSAIDTNADGTVVAGGAVALPRLARVAAGAGMAGLEFYVGIPGSVGGAVAMNAGGHGSDTAAVLVDAIVVNVNSGSLTKRNADSLRLTYRNSDLTEADVVVQATFRTTRGDPAELEASLREITRWRRQHQPGGTLNAGSVFKNPDGDAAGAIIDRCGLKGATYGPVQISPIHGNFMIASAGATAADIFSFVHEIQSEVRTKTGIELEPEIRFLGSFEQTGGGA